MRLRCHRLLLTAWMAVTACTRWTPYVAAESSAPNPPLRIGRLILRDGTSRILYDVVVRSDSVIGRAQTQDHSRFAYSRDQVRQIERSEVDGDRTFVAIVLPLLVVSIALLYVLTYLG